MKTLFVVAAVCMSSIAIAQKSSSISQRVNDDGKEMSIKINGTVDGKKIDYNRKFDITRLSDEEKDALMHRVYDSLGVPFPVAPIVPLPPSPPAIPAVPVAPSAASVSLAPAPPAVELIAPVSAAPGAPVVSAVSEFSETYAVGGDNPFTKEIKYSPQSGILYMKYRFTKDGEEVTYEKSVEAKNKSKEERANIVKKYETEIGLSRK